MARPITMPATPPMSEIRMASARNWKRISRLVAPMALRTPISRMREVTVASMMFMMPMPLTSSVTMEMRSSPQVSPVAMRSAMASSAVRFETL